MEMQKKHPVPFSKKFPNADPLAVRLLQRLLAFDPKDRPTPEQALADPYFKGLAKIEREPSCQPISKLEFEFERRRLTKEDIRELLYREILEYHPQLLKDYINGNGGPNYLYPSAIGQFRRQFAYLEENGGRSAPVFPLERKHASLPRPTVHSKTVLPDTQSASVSCQGQQAKDEASKSETTNAGNPKTARPPPRVPSAKPGRIVGSVIPYENGKNAKDGFDAKIVYRNAVLPPQTTSPHFRTTTTIQEKSGIQADGNPQAKLQPQFALVAKPAPGMVFEVNSHLYYQPQSRSGQITDRMPIETKLLQAQTQYAAVGAAAVAVTSHGSVGTVQYGLS